MKTSSKIEFGDFQTPPILADAVCSLLKSMGIKPTRIIEPTCGLGAFLAAARVAFPETPLHGFEINPEYAAQAQNAHPKATVRPVDFFSHDWDAELAGDADPLILGNPPWVTNAAVATVSGSNLPAKANIYGLRGLAAKTGKANFDIAEWIVLRLLAARHGRPATLAMLVKNATARKVLRHAWRGHLPVSGASLHLIDADTHFGAAVDACLLVARLGNTGPTEAPVFPGLVANRPKYRIGLAGVDLVADLDAYERVRAFEGLFPFQWRSGVKHDCASVLELQASADGILRNKSGESVDAEPETLYPWCKGTDLARRGGTPSHLLLLPQTSLSENACQRLANAPMALAYLRANASLFAARKSSIYRRGGEFAIFGLGSYTFAPWKVAISALHRPISFTVVGPTTGRPVLFDDTCYFVPFSNETDARTVASVLNSPAALRFFETLVFPGAKRAVTVESLSRLNFRAVAEAEKICIQGAIHDKAEREQFEMLAFT